MRKKARGVFLFILVMAVCMMACRKNEGETNAKGDIPAGKEQVTPAVTKGAEEKTGDTKKETEETGKKENENSIAGTVKKEDFPVVDGSTATIPLSTVVYKLVCGGTEEEAEKAIAHTKTTNSYYRLMNKEADLLFVYEPSEEVKQYIKDHDIKLLMKPIGKDALVFMKNKANQTESLSTSQIQDIYSGKITNWSEVGGMNQEILAFQRPKNSGSQTLMEKLVMKDTVMADGENVLRYETMDDILEAMVNYTDEANTLGYSVYFYAKNMYVLPELEFMKVNDVKPSVETIGDGTYPFVNEFYALIRADEPEDSAAHRIFDWITNEEGQNLVASIGYVPVTGTSNGAKQDNEAAKKTDLKEDERYLVFVDKNYQNIFGDVIIYDPNWNVEKYFPTSSIRSPYFGRVKEDTLVPIASAVRGEDGVYTAKTGLYDMVAQKFVLPQEYDEIERLSSRLPYYIVSKGYEDNKLIDLEENCYLDGFVQGEGAGVFMKADKIWMLQYTGDENGSYQQISIYDTSMNLLHKYEFPWDESHNLNNDGTIAFSTEIARKKMGISNDAVIELECPYVGVYNEQDDFLNLMYFDGKEYVMDNDGDVCEQCESTGIGQQYSIYGKFYGKTYGTESVKAFYDEGGNLILGSPEYSFCNLSTANYYDWLYGNELSPQYVFYGKRGDVLRVYVEDTHTHYKFLADGWENIEVTMVNQHLFCISHDEKTSFYYEDRLLFDKEGIYSNDSFLSTPTRSVFCYYDDDYNISYLILNQDGAILYESSQTEWIKSIDDAYIQTARNSYADVITYDGNYIVRNVIANIMED
ncbi:MAG: hypothetical protein E7256_11275 [Lachnospiraceae bacterium]|nr:hypothetical protein [Lachnospiraceae bacterium]